MILRALLIAFALIPAWAAGGEASLQRGREIYNFRCYFCHGYSGDAKTLAASYLDPAPASFVAAGGKLDLGRIVDTLKRGREGTAMKSFSGLLSEAEIEAVASFVMDEFVQRNAPNTRYHTVENGWPDHERYRAAYPFARGEIPLSRSWESLSREEATGKRLYLSSCVSCHDRGAATAGEPAWDSRPLSFPRNNFSLAAPAPKLDAMTSASPYALHDRRPTGLALNAQERRGERLFQNNCAFCHGADGSGKNWIGQFLEPHPRNLRDPVFMSSATRASLSQAIREGLPGTSMPAWKSVLSRDDIANVVAYISRAFHPVADGASGTLRDAALASSMEDRRRPARTSP